MSTMTVKTLCDHGRADPHHMNLGTAVCPGGKEITLRHHSYLRKSTKDESEPFEIVPVWVEADDE